MNINPYYVKRAEHESGATLYFYNVRTMMLFNYEVLYNITEGAWCSSRYPQGHSDIWAKANLLITQGKVNARTVINADCQILKNDYNLKKLLNISTAYNRIKTIGRLCLGTNDSFRKLNMLLENEIHDNYTFPLYECSQEDYEEFLDNLRDNHNNYLCETISYEEFELICNTDYPDQMMRDDLGMIQNTMRNVMTLDYL